MRVSVIALAGLLVLPVTAGAQSPSASPQPARKSDSDKKEKRVYTNDDLETAGKDGKSGKGGAVTFLSEPERPADSGHAGTSTGSSNASSEESRVNVSEEGRGAASEESGAPGERGWRERAKEKREAVQSALAEVQKLEAKLDALRNPQQQPQPIEALQPDPQRRLTRDQERIELEKELEGARQGFAEAQKALDDFMEEARRASVPPGWVEER